MLPVKILAIFCTLLLLITYFILTLLTLLAASVYWIIYRLFIKEVLKEFFLLVVFVDASFLLDGSAYER